MEAVGSLRELKGFRHVVRHAYDLTLVADRLESLVKYAEELAVGQPIRIESFIREVQTNLGEDAP